MSAGSYHTCATTAAGDTDCWGDNRDGQLGRRLTISAPGAVTAGSRAHITGRLQSIDPACIASQTVALRVLRPAGVPSRTTMTSTAGRYTFNVKITRETVVRVELAPARVMRTGPFDAAHDRSHLTRLDQIRERRAAGPGSVRRDVVDQGPR